MITWHMVTRTIKYWWQRRTRGWDDTETWNLDNTLSEIIASRLKRFKELNNGVPGCMFAEEASLTLMQDATDNAAKRWDETLDKMIAAYAWLADPGVAGIGLDTPEFVKEGQELFHKYYRALWW